MQSITVIMMLKRAVCFCGGVCISLLHGARPKKLDNCRLCALQHISHSNQSANYKQECMRVAQEVRRCSVKGCAGVRIIQSTSYNNNNNTYNLAAASLLCVCLCAIGRCNEPHEFHDLTDGSTTCQVGSAADEILSRIPETH
jgi:hypothetical protein